MKNEYDVLIIKTKTDFKQPLINDLLSKGWIKENENKYNGYGFYVEFFTKENLIILKVYVIDQWNIIHSSKKRFYGIFLSIGLQKLLNRIKDLVCKVEPNADIKHKFFHFNKNEQFPNYNF